MRSDVADGYGRPSKGDHDSIHHSLLPPPPTPPQSLSAAAARSREEEEEIALLKSFDLDYSYGPAIGTVE